MGCVTHLRKKWLKMGYLYRVVPEGGNPKEKKHFHGIIFSSYDPFLQKFTGCFPSPSREFSPRVLKGALFAPLSLLKPLGFGGADGRAQQSWKYLSKNT